MYITRPPVTDLEADILKDLASALEASHGYFCTGSFVPSLDKPVLYTHLPDTMTSSVFSLSNLDDQDLFEIHATCTPSHFGRGKELVHDEAYRLAKELPHHQFGLNFDPLGHEHGILAAISAFMPFSPGVEIRKYKLNSYGIGGQFKAHQDTPKGDMHLGTLLIGLPTQYTGGQLLIHDPLSPKPTIIDWGSEGRKDDGTYPWVFFFADKKHEITPVTSGYRMTIAYDVFATQDVRYMFPVEDYSIDVTSSPIFQQLSAALKNEEFLPNGGRLAFALSNEYPASDIDSKAPRSPGLLSILKGTDMILWQVLDALELEIEVRVVYEAFDIEEMEAYSRNCSIYHGSDEAAEEEEEAEHYPADDFCCFMRESWGGTYTNWKVLLTSESFTGVNEDSEVQTVYDDTLYKLLMENADASPERNLIWVQRPAAFSKANTFSFYGNEPSTEHVYVAGVLIVSIPFLGDDCRK